MATADRKARSARATALTCGAIAVVELAGVLLTWSGTDTPLGRQVLGDAASFALVIAAMVAVVLGMVVLVARPARAVSLVAAVLVALTTAAVAVVALASLAEGVGWLLLAAWVLSLPVLLGITRTRDRVRD